MTNKNINFLWFFLLASFWGGSFVAIKTVVDTVPPFFGAMLRVGLALFFLIIIFCVLKKKVSVPFSYRWRIWILGLFSQGIPFFFLFWGERHISSGLAGILNGTVPIWTLLFSLISPNTRNFSALKCLGLLTGLLGICVIFWPLISFNNSLEYLLGTVSVLLMAISYSIGNLLNQSILSGQIKLDFYANLYHQHWASLTFLILATLCFESWPSKAVLFHTPLLWVASIYMGLFSTALAWIIYYHLIREWDAVRASAVMYIVPIMAIFWDFIFFHNRPLWTEGLGITAILMGVVLIQLPRKRLLPKP
ncbi:MAG: DMT family transporter [Rickettsiella sp.]|nr:DMT family transporter [Rickettsiella sp.]